jgi:hypothetical protein
MGGHTPISGGRNLYQFDATAGQRFGTDQKFGLLFAGSYSEARKRGHFWGSQTDSASSYEWSFLPEAGKTFTDSGHGTCH